MISIIILILVFILIAIRQIGKIRLQIWQVMLLGAILVLLTGQISPLDAFKSINIDVMLFLFGMFIIGQALEESGYLAQLSFRFFTRAGSSRNLILFILFGAGILSAFLMNDTVAIIGTPLVLLLVKNNSIQPRILLLSLAFGVTIGSVMSPIGNPQNLLIAIDSGIANPFITFFRYLFLPTIINLFIAYIFLHYFYRKHFVSHINISNKSPEPIQDKRLALFTKISLILLVIMILAKIIIVSIGISIDFKLTYIALVSALPIVLASRRRFEIVRNIDWSTLVFFASMFILMQSVWNSGVIQSILTNVTHDLTAIGTIFGISVVVSQFISNVPLVALYLPVVIQSGMKIKGFMALASGSTIAGNLSILGAASNVIIIQNAEKRSGLSVTFFDFVKIGIPLTIINMIVYWIFLTLLP